MPRFHQLGLILMCLSVLGLAGCSASGDNVQVSGDFVCKPIPAPESTCTVTLINDPSSATFYWSASSDTGDLQFTPAHGQLAPGSKTTISVLVPARYCHAPISFVDGPTATEVKADLKPLCRKT